MSFFDRMAESNDRKFFGGQASNASDKSNTDKSTSLLTCLDGKPDWAAGGGSGGAGGSDDGSGFEAFDRHAIVYIFIMALILTICIGHEGITGEAVLGATFAFGVVGSMGYYTLKAIFITTGTYFTWKEAHPGESIWDQDGGLTSYDQNFADAIGRASAGKGSQSNQSNSGLTSYDKAMAAEIARNMRKD